LLHTYEKLPGIFIFSCLGEPEQSWNGLGLGRKLGTLDITRFVVVVNVPHGVVTVIAPLLLATPVTAVITVSETTINDAAFTPLNLTEVVPRKFAPFMVTVLPDEHTNNGSKLLMTGAQGVGTAAVKLPKDFGTDPTETVVKTVLVAVLITLTVLLPSLATYTLVPSWLTLIPFGDVPTATLPSPAFVKAFQILTAAEL
jgi:hypothetical protein